MATGATSVVQRGTRIAALVSLILGFLFFAAAKGAGAPPGAQYGGALWVSVLSLLLALPLLTTLLRRRAGR